MSCKVFREPKQNKKSLTSKWHQNSSKMIIHFDIWFRVVWNPFLHLKQDKYIFECWRERERENKDAEYKECKKREQIYYRDYLLLFCLSPQNTQHAKIHRIIVDSREFGVRFRQTIYLAHYLIALVFQIPAHFIYGLTNTTKVAATAAAACDRH